MKKAWEEFLNKHQGYQIFHCHARRYASLILPIIKKHHLVSIMHSHNTSDGKGVNACLKYLLQIQHILDNFLNEKALVPAFIDTHQHFASFALFHSGLNVMDASSNVEIQEMVKAYLEKRKK